jgi:hypothetical protein
MSQPHPSLTLRAPSIVRKALQGTEFLDIRPFDTPHGAKAYPTLSQPPTLSISFSLSLHPNLPTYPPTYSQKQKKKINATSSSASSARPTNHQPTPTKSAHPPAGFTHMLSQPHITHKRHENWHTRMHPSSKPASKPGMKAQYTAQHSTAQHSTAQHSTNSLLIELPPLTLCLGGRKKNPDPSAFHHACSSSGKSIICSLSLPNPPISNTGVNQSQ